MKNEIKRAFRVSYKDSRFGAQDTILTYREALNFMTELAFNEFVSEVVLKEI